jgi:hypothetical protein
MKKFLLATVATVALAAGGAIAAESGKDGMKAGADGKAGTSMKSKSETTGAGSGAQTQSGAPADPSSPNIKRPSDGGSKASGMKAGSQAGEAAGMKSSATTGSAAGSSVSLTQEQRSKIRTTVIQGGKAPKIERSQINFSLNVGAVVPRSVRVVAVPPTLVEIHPAWRGYMYFVVGDELVIVEPRTLKIVAVLAV